MSYTKGMKDEFDTLLKKPMDRKGFLKTVGIGAATIVGVAAIAKTLDVMTRHDKDKLPASVVMTEEVKKAAATIKPQNKIVRTICYFTDSPSDETIRRLEALASMLESKGYTIQTKRICSKDSDIKKLADQVSDKSISLNVGTISFDSATRQLPEFYKVDNVSFNVDLTNTVLDHRHVDVIFRTIREKPSHTFNYSYVFNNPSSSPFFPAAHYEREGFAIGLEPTDLAEDAGSIEAWLLAMRACWHEIDELFTGEPDFLGIDGSIAPFGTGKGSLINFVKRLGYSFERSTTTDMYTKITHTLKTKNPRPVGLNGLMFPCLEDFDLAAEYEKGQFSLERSLFLSLHSGVGIDTYPIGIDEKPERVLEILQVTQALSNKYKKPLAVRFASDGVAKIGDRTNHQSQYLTDCIVRAL
ncbi:MAG TPA: DUF711 family protein [Candidatus Saccharimonadales bacterium]|nr:DUF711 family protein [Candidatus Saccharimonadales bacterium]